MKLHGMGIERRSRGLGARRLSFIKEQLCGMVVERVRDWSYGQGG